MTRPPKALLVVTALVALTFGAQAAPRSDSEPAQTSQKAAGKTAAAKMAAAKTGAAATKQAAAKTAASRAASAKAAKGAATKAKAKAAGKKAPAATEAAGKKPAPASAKTGKTTAAAKAAKPIASAPVMHPPLPRPRPVVLASAVAGPSVAFTTASVGHVLSPASLTNAPSSLAPPGPVVSVSAPALSAPALPPSETKASAADLATVKQALALVRRGKTTEAGALQSAIRDPAARKLIEWAILRSDDNEASAARYSAFIAANPNWATVRMFRRRAENQIWTEKLGADAVRAFFAQSKPTTAKGRFALARALLAQGDRTTAASYVRETWRYDEFGAELETQAMEVFGDLITRADHKARMDRRLYADDVEAAQRAAKRLGAVEMAIVKARAAVASRDDKAGALLESLPQQARQDAGVMFARSVWLRRKDRIADAAQVLLAAPRDPNVILDTNEWWVERRLLARKLLDIGDPQTAYRVVREAARPAKENYRGEHEFTAGWIALRFLERPDVALAHFARVGQGTTNPITLARAAYWQARACEALGRHDEVRTHYEAASRYPTAYYGQIARNKLGLAEVGLRRPPHPQGAQLHAIRNLDIVRAVEILYALDERDFVHPMVADLADRVVDVGALVLIAEIAQQNRDARALLLIGKAVQSRGYAFDRYAFPTIGVPAFSAVGPEVDRSIVYAIVRQESAFNQRTVSTAKALGLMQVTPPAGRNIAKKFGVTFDQKRLLADPVYNTQMGSAELGDLLKDYRGSYILSFAAYNAGRGRVRDWIQRFGDPRDGAVDPIDWVERIPFSETRNYVQRVMENMQVYRARFASGAKLLIEADLRRGGNGQ